MTPKIDPIVESTLNEAYKESLIIKAIEKAYDCTFTGLNDKDEPVFMKRPVVHKMEVEIKLEV